MSDHTEYLAVNVLNESHTVSYRMLSRALKVHSNRAKQLLYDFYSRQNGKKAGSVFATYIVTGRQRQHGHTNGFASQASDDNLIPSSPFPGSLAPLPSQDSTEQPSWSKVVVVVKETDLESVKAAITEVECVHIYSISPAAISDLYILADCTRKVRVEYASEDPLERWAQYGTIQNPNVWRRTRNGQPVPVAAPATQPASQAAAQPPKPQSAASKPESAAPAAAAAPPSRTASSSQSKAAPPTLKNERSSIMSSFAKSKPPPPKKAEAPAPVDDTPALSDEDMLDDDDDGLMDLDAGAVDQQKTEGKSKKERADELRKMMDEDDDVANEPAGDVEMQDAEAPTPAEDHATPDPAKDDEKEAKVEVSNGRRRGRRRVMKKKTVKDDEGYLVTKEEAVWESFSEDEAPAAKKARPAVSGPAAAATKASDKGAAAGKKGGKAQNSIMSFFAKK